MTYVRARWSRAFAFAACVFALAGSGTAAFAQQSGDRFQGILSVVWADPHPSLRGSHRAGKRFTITYPDGTRVPLDVGPDLENLAVQHVGKRVVVRGNASAESGRQRIKVESIEGPETAPLAEAATTKRVLFILLRFKGDTQKPHPPNFFKQITNPLTPPVGVPATINAFFNKVSYGKLKWAADVAGVGGLNPTQWLTLPRTRAYYVPCGKNDACSNLDAIGDDAIDLVTAAGVNVDNYDNINFVLNNDLDCCAWGGTYVRGMRSWGATWEPPWGQEVSTYVHEMGHSLGLPHSGWRYYAYDSHHDEMSRGHAAQTIVCGTYNSVLFGGPNTPIGCSEPGAGYIMAHQMFLGWVPAGRKAVHSTKSVQAYNIEANSLPLGTSNKVVVICIAGSPCTGGGARYLTVEVKARAAQYDNGVPSQGVVIHDVMMNRPAIDGPCYFNDQSGWAVPFDAHPGDFNSNTCGPKDTAGTGLLDMAYGVGDIFNSAALGIKVEVVSRNGDVYRVKVTKTK